MRNNSDWVYGGFTYRFNSHPCIVVYAPVEKENMPRSYDDNWDVYVDVFEDTIGQLTGLKDRNGKDVYEKDIMEYKGCIGVVTYYAGRGQFQLKVKGHPPITLHNLKGTILGNIFENPEYLDKL